MNAAGMAVSSIDTDRREAPDSHLVAAVRAGDDSAFAELYRRHQPAVARFVRGRVRDHGRSEDVVQEAFVSALRRLRQTDAEIAFRAWIFEIARNASIDLYRRSSRAEEVSMDAEGGLAAADATRLGVVPAPDSSLLRKESFDHFRGALDELSATHHRIIVMRELEGRSYREIGESMALSQAAVESTLFRARRKLEHEYDQIDSGRRCRTIGAAIGRLAEGLESRRDRVSLDRHARRCSACRRQARQMGVEPILERDRRGPISRAAALLPLPAFLRRRPAGGDSVAGSGVHGGAGQALAMAPSLEAAGGMAGKAIAVIAAAAFIGGSGATLGGVGPLAVGADTPVGVERSAPAGGRDAGPERPRTPAPDPPVTRLVPEPPAPAATEVLPSQSPPTVRPAPAPPRPDSAAPAPAPQPDPKPPATELPGVGGPNGEGGAYSGDAAAIEAILVAPPPAEPPPASGFALGAAAPSDPAATQGLETAGAAAMAGAASLVSQ